MTWLAGEIGAAVSTVSGYARGKVPPGLMAARIADVLDMDLIWYLTGREPNSVLPAGAVRVARISPDGTELGGIPFDADEVAREAGTGEVLALSVAGNAMIPTVAPGADVLFSTRCRKAEDGRLHVLRMDGRLVVRRVEVLAAGGFLLVCDNPAFPAETVPFGGMAEIIGRVFAVISRH